MIGPGSDKNDDGCQWITFAKVFIFEHLDDNDKNNENGETDNNDDGRGWITFARFNPPFCETLTGPNVASNSLDQHGEEITNLE